MEILIRKYEDHDLEDVNHVLKEAFSVTKKNFTSDNFYEVVACVDDKVVGYLLLTWVFNPIREKKYFLIDYVCVLSSYRGRGIADEMMKYAEEIARENDAIYMQLTCGYQRVQAHKLYERCGFVKRDSDLFRKELI